MQDQLPGRIALFVVLLIHSSSYSSIIGRSFGLVISLFVSILSGFIHASFTRPDADKWHSAPLCFSFVAIAAKTIAADCAEHFKFKAQLWHGYS
jgi:hypothetical protein